LLLLLLMTGLFENVSDAITWGSGEEFCQ